MTTNGGANNPPLSDAMSSRGPYSDASDVEQHAGMDVDEVNLGQRFQDQDLEQLIADTIHSEIPSESTAFLPTEPQRSSAKMTVPRPKSKFKWMRGSAGGQREEEDDIPDSLLLEAIGDPNRRRGSKSKARALPDELPPPVPGPATRTARAQWQATRAQQRLHDDFREQEQTPQERSASVHAPRAVIADPKQRAMWKWANVDNLDRFLEQVYGYYVSHGIWSILLKGVLQLLTTAFLAFFITFLTQCIDYSKLPQGKKMSDIYIPHCTKNMPTLPAVFLWLFTAHWVLSVVTLVSRVPRLLEMHNFYHYLLDIPDADIQTASWPLVVGRLMALRDSNATTVEYQSAAHRAFLQGQSKQRMDAQDIANRIMRRENYFIAIVNKDILDLTVPIPFLGSRQFFTKTVEWTIGLALMDFVFDDHGHIHPEFLDIKRRQQLILKLKQRFNVVGLISIFIAPFLCSGAILYQFLSNFTEYQKNPSHLGSRAFSSLAEWKFREFNELWHLFNKRQLMAYPYAGHYLDQFPKDKMVQLYQFAAFVSGSIAAVLGIASLLDPELFLGFELSPGKTVIFWLGILTAIYAGARAAVPEDEYALDPEEALQNVIACTHYCPATWEDRLHTDDVRREFSGFYKLKLQLFLEEALGMIFLPYIMIFSLPNCADRLVDFFREFTIHVHGLGHVCYFAEFKPAKVGENPTTIRSAPQNVNADDDSDLRDDYYNAKDDKMYRSQMTFQRDHGMLPPQYLPSRSMRKSKLFMPPPPFPGLASPTFGADGTGPLRKPRTGRQSTHRTSRFGPVGNHAHGSPMHSILLDPHHQPSGGVVRHSPKHGSQKRYRSGGRLHLEAEEMEEERNVNRASKQANVLGDPIEEDSELGDSWRTTKAAHDDADDGRGVGRRPVDNGAGVLGIIYQFQKAQTDARGI